MLKRPQRVEAMDGRNTNRLERFEHHECVRSSFRDGPTGAEYMDVRSNPAGPTIPHSNLMAVRMNP
jgi:hypothetical protein